MYGMQVLGFAFLGVFFSLTAIDPSFATPLDDYVRAPDPTFNWTVIRTYQQPDYVLYILNFTSQKWFDGRFFALFCHTRMRIDARFSRNILQSSDLVALLVHQCTTYIDSTWRCLHADRRWQQQQWVTPLWSFIDPLPSISRSSSYSFRMPKPEDNFVALTSMFAVSSGSIGVDLQDIPNEPIRFVVRRKLLLSNDRWCSTLSALACTFRPIHRRRIGVKMPSLHGRGKHSLRILIIRTFYSVCQWRK